MPARSARRLLLVACAVLPLVAAGCELAPPPGTSHTPSGNLEVVATMDPFACDDPNPWNCVRVEGWAWDWDWPFPPTVVFAVFQDGRLRWDLDPTMSVPRPDVQAAFGRGYWSGFRGTLVIDGPATVCAVAVNQGPGDHSILGCRPVSPSG